MVQRYIILWRQQNNRALFSYYIYNVLYIKGVIIGIYGNIPQYMKKGTKINNIKIWK